MATSEEAMTETRHKLLLVEDDRALASFLAAQLAYFNYDTVIKHDLSALQKSIEQAQPDAILMDVTFAEGDLAGPKNLAVLAAQGTHLPPAIIFSGRTDFPAKLAALHAGAKAYFAKPLDCALIADALDRLMPEHVPEPYNVLIIDDSTSQSRFYEAILRNVGMNTLIVNDPSKAEDALATFPAELILMDMYMPICSGVDLAEILRYDNKYLSIPIVFLSSEANERIQLSAMKAGGDAFLVKPIQPERLVEMVTLRVERYRELRKMMVRDSLTGLLNHSTFEQMLEAERSRALRQGTTLTMVMVDIDHFKQVNDTYGHQAGDNVIRSLSRLLQQRLRKSDLIGRYGGEEFAIAMPGTSIESAQAVMETIRHAFENLIQRAGTQTFHATFSCGIASLSGHVPAARLTSMADTALYSAKNAGRNRVWVHETDTTG